MPATLRWARLPRSMKKTMDNLLSKITENLLRQKSVVLVGSTDSGKTYWIQNTLIPHLESLNNKVEYLKDGSELSKGSPGVVICDEVETLFDKDYLQGSSPEDYYTPEYLEKVRQWHENYARLPKSTLFVITRNKPDQIKNLLENFRKSDWDDREVVVFKFEK
ncbi:MAG: hypothetical protein A3J01_00750 [Candidatus Yanofskybacteria bacterium RIFCSPLOWO2_02_FULL_45_18]|uniref:ATPase dynein-related AAA domain-containing protein n=1 Tax=Candidatus Yanofskybacteria bacterium RIFCSPLOWO2_02_FULL_45_18 TaxID=1802707 RepID=A0A1F8H2G0_9BACT|nr:MAG: hypothetical protein A3J01_00750 [Candidatus Yanofskybacteria bacterium RIFCSPLOWO2_02_FULL_45_18]